MTASSDECWVLTDGKIGMVNQALGLAEAIGLPIREITVSVRAPWRWLPAWAWVKPFSALGPDSDPIAPPWPRLLICSGRMSVPFSLAIGRASPGTCRVQIQDPKVSPKRFDLIITPQHDRLAEGDGVIKTLGSMHRVTPDRLAGEGEKWRDRLADLPRPLYAVLLGGSNKVYDMTPAVMANIADTLAGLHRETGAGFAITASRRTGEANIAALKARLADVPHQLWEGAGENPYFGYLALCDRIIATCDSVNMVTEAASTGKPVQIAMLEGGGAKFDRFHDAMRRYGATRPLALTAQEWTYTPLRETERIAQIITQAMEDNGRP